MSSMKCSSLTNMKRHLWQVNAGRAVSKFNSAAIMECIFMNRYEVAVKICNLLEPKTAFKQR